MEKNERLSLLINYLDVLCRGKVRPNRNGHGVVQDAKFNIDDIDAVKDEINKQFDITVTRTRRNEREDD